MLLLLLLLQALLSCVLCSCQWMEASMQSALFSGH
jgi:hypothetical protein